MSRSPHERSAADRERDRLERARRRAEREGQSPPDSVPADVADPEVPPPAQPPPAEPSAAAAPIESAPPIERDAAFPHEPEQVEPEHVDPHLAEPTFAEEPEHEHDADTASHEPAAADDLEDAPPLPPPVPEQPRRTIQIGRAAREAEAAPPPDGAPAPPRRLRRPHLRDAHGGGHRPRLTRARIAALVALALAVALVWFLVSLFQPFAGSGSGRVIVVIPKGASSGKIGSILANDGVVSSGFFFDLRATLAGKRGSLHSGRFELKHGMSYSAAIDALSKPPPKAIVVKVVIPEGYTRRQIADLAGQDALTGSYLEASTRSRLLSPRRYGAPAGTPNLEGFLFPATYELKAGAPAQRLVEEQLAAFRERFTRADVRRAHALKVTPYQLLIVASMVEREAAVASDRPKIAAVIYNRLREGVPLGIDATTVYAIELQRNVATFTGELTESELKSESPYNTRTHKGLPPTPISNPGSASIEAAAHPAHVPYMYYVAAADGCGEHVFSRANAEFEKNVAAYQAALERNGGRPPTCKKK